MSFLKRESERDAAIYGRIWSDYPPSPPSTSSRELVEHLKREFPNEPIDVLDLACGAGRHALLFAENGFRVLAIDHNEEGILALESEAKRKSCRVAAIRQEAVDFLLSDAGDQTFHAAVLFDALHHMADTVDDARQLLSRFTCKVRPGGMVLLAVLTDICYSAGPPPKERLHLSAQAARSLLEEVLAGWQIRKVKQKSLSQSAVNYDYETRALLSCTYTAERNLVMAQKQK